MTLSEEIRGLVHQYFSDGFTKIEISKLLKISERSVYRILSQSDGNLTVTKRKKVMEMRSGCIKRGFNAVKRTRLLITSSKIKRKLPINLSISTIRRYLIKLKYKYRPALRKIILSEIQKENRVRIVRNWIRAKLDPDLVVFTDESRFSLDGNDSLRSWMNKNNHILPKRPYRGGSLMVWGAISKSGEIILRRIYGKLNSEKYCNLMETDILPYLNKSIRTYIFQQDNASCHVSKKTIEMFERNHAILLEWPAKSPDLSLIEQLWGILKKRIYDGTKYDDLDQLWNRINEEIALIKQSDPDLISRLWNNYSDKMCDILCTNGCLLK